MNEITLEDIATNSFFEDLSKGRYILVLGAGFSYGIKNCSETFKTIPIVSQFTELTKRMLSDSEKEEYKSKEYPINRAVIEWKNQLIKGNKTFCDFKELFLVKETDFNYNLYEFILKPKWAGIYTFNFDNVLDVLIKEERDNYDLKFISGMFEHDVRRKIGYLHNSILNATTISDLIFANYQYGDQANDDNTLYFSLYNQLQFHNKNLIIVGCGFAEQSLYKFLTRIDRKDLKIIHINFDEKPDYDPDFLNKVPDVSWINRTATDFLQFLQDNEDKLNPITTDDFDPYAHTYQGRKTELKSISDFFKGDRHFLFLHGAGGMGKTHALKYIINNLELKYKYVKLIETHTLYSIADKLKLGKIDANNEYDDFKKKISEQEEVIIIDDLYNIRTNKILYDFIVGLSSVSKGKIIILSRTVPEKYNEIGIIVFDIEFKLLEENDHNLFVNEYYQLKFHKEIDGTLLTKIWNISKGYPLISEVLVENTFHPDFNIDDVSHWNFNEDKKQQEVIKRLLDTYLNKSNKEEKELILDIATSIEDINIEIIKCLPSYIEGGRTALNSILERKHIIRYEEGTKITMHPLIRELLYKNAGSRTATHLAYANYYNKLAIDSNYNNTIAFNLAYYHFRNSESDDLLKFKNQANATLVNVNVKQLLSDNIDADIDKLLYRKNENPTDNSTYDVLGKLYRLKEDFENCIKILNEGLSLEGQNENEYLLFNKAYSLIHFERNKEAERILDILVEKGNELGLKFKGILLFKKKNFPEAEKYFDIILKDDPDNAQALQYKGMLMFQYHKNFPEAEKYFDIILKDDPDNAQALQYKGMLMFQYHKNFPEAEKYFDIILKDDPDNAQALLYKGMLMFQYHKNFPEAEKYFDIILKDDPDNAQALLYKGMLMFQYHKNFPEAEKYFDIILKDDPDNAQALLYKGMLMFQYHKNFPEAEKYFDIILKDDPDNAQALLYKGMLMFQYHKNFPEAEKYFDIILKDDPDNAQALLYKGMLMFQYHKNFPEAEKYFDIILKDDPDNAQALLYKGMVLLKLEHIAEAIIILIKAKKHDNNNYYIINQLGVAYRYNHQYDIAINCFNEALKLKPDNVQSYDGLFKCYVAQEKFKDALITVDRLLNNNLKDKRILESGIYLCIDLKYKIHDFIKAKHFLGKLETIKFKNKEDQIKILIEKIEKCAKHHLSKRKT